MTFQIKKSQLKRITIIAVALISVLTVAMTIKQSEIKGTNTEEPASVSMGEVELYVKDLSVMKQFYGTLSGLSVINETDDLLEMGDDGEVIMRFYKVEPYAPQNPREAGLYHTAIVFPTRQLLAQSLDRVLNERSDLYQGSSDHVATEAFYFADPEGNGVELYYDKPRSDWKYDTNGKPLMGSTYIPERNYVAQYLNDQSDESNEDIKMGHVHLRVGDIARAREFYSEIIEFEIMNERDSALFVARDGYHHYLGMNTWESFGSSERTPDRYGLKRFIINIHDESLFQKIRENAQDKGVMIESDNKSVLLKDPWGTEVLLVLK